MGEREGEGERGGEEGGEWERRGGGRGELGGEMKKCSSLFYTMQCTFTQKCWKIA